MTAPADQGYAIALAHAAKGRRVFPWRPTLEPGKSKPTKKPLTVRGHLDATTDERTIIEWWKRWPNAFVGWALPEGIGLVDVDDPAKAAGLDLPPAPEQRGTLTRPDGLHRLYAVPDGRQTQGELPGVDTRVGGAGWVALYSADAFAGEPPPAPDWFPRERTVPSGTVEPFVSIAKDSPVGKALAEGRLYLPDGKRDGGLASIAGALIKAGATPDATELALKLLDAAGAVERVPGDTYTADDFHRIAFSMDRTDLRRHGPRVGNPTPVGIDAADLLAMDIPPLRMIVPDLLPDGTTVLASPPKVGKSCLVYQIAVEVALGGALLGRRVEPGSVLYLALEDGARRGQDRLRAALNGRTMPGGRLEVRWSAPPIGAGLEEDLAAWLDSHGDAAVVAIDTLQKVRQRTNGKRGAYEVDVDDLGRLQNVFRDRRVALLIVHHSRKESGDDFLASVSGTYGITGSADTIVVLRRVRMESFGTIRATGRDIPEAEVPVQFDGMLWREAPGSLPEASFERQEVYQVIASRGPIFPAAIAKELGTTRQNVQNMVGALHQSGAVARTSGGYTVTNPGVSISSVSLMSGGDIGAIGHTREIVEPPDLWAEAQRIFGDEVSA
jgi:hypothetical protein